MNCTIVFDRKKATSCRVGKLSCTSFYSFKSYLFSKVRSGKDVRRRRKKKIEGHLKRINVIGKQCCFPLRGKCDAFEC